MKMVFDIGDYYGVCVVWLLNFQLVIVISGDPDWNAYTINLSIYSAFQIMNDHHREILRKNRVYFIKNLKMVDLIDHVADIVTQDHEEKIMGKLTNREQVVCFLGILERRGRDAFTNFLVALENAECNFVKEYLEKQDQRRKQDCVDGCDEVDFGPVQETKNGNV